MKRPKVGPYEVYLNEFEKLSLPIFEKVNKLLAIIC